MHLLDVINWSANQLNFVEFLEKQNINFESMISVSANTVVANLLNLKIEITFTFLTPEAPFKIVIAELINSDSEFSIIKLFVKDYSSEFENPGSGIA